MEERIYLFSWLFYANLSNTLMCVLLNLLICTALRAHIIVVEAIQKINCYYMYEEQTYLSLYEFALHINCYYMYEEQTATISSVPPPTPMMS